MDSALKYKIVEKIVQSNDDLLLNQIKSLLGIPDNEFWNELPKVLKEEIISAKEELDNNLGTPHAEVMAELNHLLN